MDPVVAAAVEVHGRTLVTACIVWCCYDHALLVTGYDVLLLTLQGSLSFSASSVSSFASTHAGLDCFSLLDLYPRHLAYRTHASNPHHVYCLTDSLVPLISSSHSP